MTELTEVKVLPNTESCEEKKLEIFNMKMNKYIY